MFCVIYCNPGQQYCLSVFCSISWCQGRGGRGTKQSWAAQCCSELLLPLLPSVLLSWEEARGCDLSTGQNWPTVFLFPCSWIFPGWCLHSLCLYLAWRTLTFSVHINTQLCVKPFECCVLIFTSSQSVLSGSNITCLAKLSVFSGAHLSSLHGG